jgi:hypothetical protein
MEAFLLGLLPRILPDPVGHEVHAFQGKGDLLAKLPARLRAYSRFLPHDWRLVVVVDRDDDDCVQLKQELESTAQRAGLISRTRAAGNPWQLVNRIAIEELEAWYFGEWTAVRDEFPRVPATIPAKQPYRDCDRIAGGTWEAFERVVQRAGYFPTGLPKIDTARQLAQRFEADRCTSTSYRAFHSALVEAVAL